MNEPEETHRIDQALASMADNMPPMWRRLYENCITEGFTKDEAFKLVCTTVHGLCGGKMIAG